MVYKLSLMARNFAVLRRVGEPCKRSWTRVELFTVSASELVLFVPHSIFMNQGVNTGFGGSADTRTLEANKLQETLLRELHGGILSTPNSHSKLEKRVDRGMMGIEYERIPDDVLDLADSMLKLWVRASIIVRINSLASGLSGVRPAILQSMIELLKHDIVPRVPLRGSISASGDLMPLSYI